MQPFAGLTDAGIAISAAILLFVLPCGPLADRRRFLMDWPTATRVPWGLLLLFGGGLSLAASFEQTGLADYVAAQGQGLERLPDLGAGAGIATVVVFLSEIASNVATATTVVPVLASLAIGAGPGTRAAGAGCLLCSELRLHAAGGHAPECHRLWNWPRHSRSDGQGGLSAEYAGHSVYYGGDLRDHYPVHRSEVMRRRPADLCDPVSGRASPGIGHAAAGRVRGPRRTPLSWRRMSQLVGEITTVAASHDDTLTDIARVHGLGYEEIVWANPTVDIWLPGEGTQVTLPTRFVLPGATREGIVVNIAEYRLYHYYKRNGQMMVSTFPISIGRMDWATPIGRWAVTAKQKDPAWYPPESIRQEHLEDGRGFLAKMVPAGSRQSARPVRHASQRQRLSDSRDQQAGGCGHAGDPRLHPDVPRGHRVAVSPDPGQDAGDDHEPALQVRLVGQ